MCLTKHDQGKYKAEDIYQSGLIHIFLVNLTVILKKNGIVFVIPKSGNEHM